MTEYFDYVDYPSVRIRFDLETELGRPTRFVVQLEYFVENEWWVVARFDHDDSNEHAHDVRHDGLHMDVYRNREKHRVERGFPPVPLSAAPRYSKTYLQTHADQLIRRFERWHDLNRR